MTPSWYDVLDVETSASTDEIRTAWKSGIAELDPGHRKFRLLSQAAEVLLDPTRRAAHDAELAADADVEAEPAPARKQESPDRDVPPPPAPSDEPAGRRLSSWPVLALAALTVVVLVGTVLSWVRFGDEVDVPGVGGAEVSLEESASEAQSVAEQAIVPVLSYDYRTLEDDAAAARSYMTEDYQEKYDQLFAVLEESAPGAQAVQDTEVVASGIVRTGEDRVDVLVYVNRPTTNKEFVEPRIFSDWTTVRMLRVDGDWLVDALCTTGASC